MKKMIQKIKLFLKRFLPPSSKTVNARLDAIERKINQMSLFYLMCKANEIRETHIDTFLPYKGIHQGQEVVVVGAGPTLNYYKPIEGAIHIGVNGTYHCKNINLDYYFIQDFAAVQVHGTVSLSELKELNCKKFVGQYIKKVGNAKMIAPQYIADYIGAKNYYVQDYLPGYVGNRFPLNIEFYPIIDNLSTIFAAIQFALYTHPKKIFIVGCDCSDLLGQHFDGTDGVPMYFDRVYKNWLLMKDHISAFYPDIEVVSVNPVGLVNLFEDMYTPEYLSIKEQFEEK